MRKNLLLTVLISVLYMIGCNTAKQTQKRINKAMKYHPALVAIVCIDSFPCITSTIDTVTNIEYDFIEIQCPGNNDKIIIDTIWLTKNNTKIVKGPGVIVTENHYNTITKVVKDSAETLVYKYKNQQLQTENNKLTVKLNKRNNWLLYLVIALLCSIILNILMLKK